MIKSLRLSMIIFSFILCLNPAAIAGEESLGDYTYDASHQVGRGLVNVVSSLAEIPCTMSTDIKEQGGAGVATGLGKGLWYTFRRILVGATEVVTFVLPAPPVLNPVCQTKPAANLA